APLVSVSRRTLGPPESKLRACRRAVLPPVAVASTAHQKRHAAPGTPQLPPVDHQSSIRKLGTVDAVGQSTAHTSRGFRRARHGRPGAPARKAAGSSSISRRRSSLTNEPPGQFPPTSAQTLDPVTSVEVGSILAG